MFTFGLICCPEDMFIKCSAGILDQGNGCLQVFEEQDEDEAYPAAIETINNMSSVVDALFTRSQKLVA